MSAPVTDVFEKLRLVSDRLRRNEARLAEELWAVGRLKAVIETIQDATATYGIVNDAGDATTPMMVERDAIVEALYGER